MVQTRENMVHVISGPGKPEVEAVNYDFKMVQREHCTENGALCLHISIKTESWSNMGRNRAGKHWCGRWEPAVCVAGTPALPWQRWSWKTCLVTCWCVES